MSTLQFASMDILRLAYEGALPAATAVKLMLSGGRKRSEKIYATLKPVFDTAYYFESNPDLPRSIDALAHYILVGWREGRNPCDWFSSTGYLEANPDVRAAGIEPFFHYIKYGSAEHRPAGGRGALAFASAGRALSVPRAPLKLSALERERVKERLAASGLRSLAIVESFDAAYYRFLAGSALEDEAACLLHFAEVGYAELLPISDTLAFDPQFYRACIKDARALDDVEAYRHWLNRGLASGVAPNEARFLDTIGLAPGGFVFDADLYAASNRTLAEELGSPWLLLKHFVQKGAGEGRLGCPLTPETVDIHFAAADHLAVSGRDRDAQRIYERVLEVAPGRMRMSHYGDCLFRLGQFRAAASAYRRGLEFGETGIHSYVNLASCLAEIDRLEEACAVVDTAMEQFPFDHGLRGRRLELTKRRFEAGMSAASVLARAGRYAPAIAGVAASVRELAAWCKPASLARPTATRIRRVAIVGDHGLPQCRLYRIDQKLEQLAAIGIGAVAFKSAGGVKDFMARVHEFDAAIFYRVPAWLEVLQAISTARQLGLPTFYEIDDLIFDGEHYPDTYESYEGLITRDEYASLVTGTELFKTALEACDFAIASTPSLARHMTCAGTGKVFVHRNALGSVHRRAIASAKPRADGETAGPVVIFYGSGTKAHKQDFATLVAPAMARLFEAHGERVRLRLAGFQSIPVSLERYSDQIELLAPNWDVEAYWKELGKADINLAVLGRSVATDAKSEIKWLEAAMLGVPSVVSRCPVYEEAVRHAETGFLAASPEDWFDALDALIKDPALRAGVGDAARRESLARYGEEQMAANLANIFQAVLPPPAPAAKRRKRILVVNVFYPPQSIGGATRVVHDNVAELTRRYGDDFEIEVFTTQMGGTEPYRASSYAWDGVRVTAVTAPSEPRIDWKYADESMGRLFRNLLRDRAPDLIHFHCIQRLTASLAITARDLGIPYVVTAHDAWWISERQFLVDPMGRQDLYSRSHSVNVERYGTPAAERARVLREALSGARTIAAVSEPFAEIYRSAGFDRVISIANGVSALPEVARPASPDGRVTLGYIGGLEWHKGYPLVRAAFRKRAYRNLRLLIVDHAKGPGFTREESWGETPVTYIGRVAQAHVGLVYSRMDVLLAPSIWPESFGLVTREAIASGLWVVASDRGAVGECVDHGRNGFVIPVDRADGLIGALDQIEADPARFRTVPPASGALRTCAEQADDLAALYKEILG